MVKKTPQLNQLELFIWLQRISAMCSKYQIKRYLVFLCARGQAFDLGAQLNKHVSYGCDAGVEVFVFIVLCTEILLVPPTLLQSHDGAVCAMRRHTDTRANDDIILAHITDSHLILL